MFGYIICNKTGLSDEELDRYQGFYCGVCKSLEERFGQIERASLNYEMTFLAMFLSALYEPEEKHCEFRCSFHPFHKKPMIRNQFTEYAADMTIVLAYFKCIDDWKDDKNAISAQFARMLKSKYEEVKLKYPRQCRTVAESIKQLDEVEEDPRASADLAINLSGRMLSEMFVYKEDFWSSTLRQFGYELGRFIYLMDAAMDYKEDQKKKHYNPLFKFKKKPEEVQPLLTSMIGNAAEQFEKLPIIQDEHILRNIIYGGVWQKYYAQFLNKDRAKEKKNRDKMKTSRRKDKV